MSDREWYETPWVCEELRAAHLDEAIYAARPVEGSSTTECIGIYRPPGDRDFTEEDRGDCLPPQPGRPSSLRASGPLRRRRGDAGTAAPSGADARATVLRQVREGDRPRGSASAATPCTSTSRRSTGSSASRAAPSSSFAASAKRSRARALGGRASDPRRRAGLAPSLFSAGGAPGARPARGTPASAPRGGPSSRGARARTPWSRRAGSSRVRVA